MSGHADRLASIIARHESCEGEWCSLADEGLPLDTLRTAEAALREVAKLRASLEDARIAAAFVVLARERGDSVPAMILDAAKRAVDAHPAPAPVERSTLDVIGRIGSDGYRAIDLRDKAPAQAKCKACMDTVPDDGISRCRSCGCYR